MPECPYSPFPKTLQRVENVISELLDVFKDFPEETVEQSVIMRPIVIDLWITWLVDILHFPTLKTKQNKTPKHDLILLSHYSVLDISGVSCFPLLKILQ